MYKDNNETFKPNSKEGKKVIRVLNFMGLIFRADIPEMKIKWGFVDLYLLISYIMDNYSVRATNEYADRFRAFFVKFEGVRLPRVHNPSALLDPPTDAWKRDLYEYIINFQMSAGTKINIQKRHEVYLRFFLQDNLDLVVLDPTRLFTDDERMVLWRRADGKCEVCGDYVAYDDMEGGHIIDWADGGPTTLSNGRCECRGRHR
jgi:hypothetical protein